MSLPRARSARNAIRPALGLYDPSGLLGPPPPILAAASSHAATFLLGGHVYRLRVWTAREWEATPERDRPHGAIPFDDGYGWHALEPTDQSELGMVRPRLASFAPVDPGE